MRELIADETIEVLFIRTKENLSDILTKNWDCATFEKHEGELVEEIQEELLRELGMMVMSMQMRG